MLNKNIEKVKLIKHKQDCQMSFGKKDSSCPRCQELIAGAPARSGWQKDYFVNKKREQEQNLKWLKEHDCSKSGCSVICTEGEY